jgi:site-specific DNA-methyltransferase (adenine-specific)
MSDATVRADCFAWLADRPPASVHAVCTDPPYGLVEFAPDQVAKLRAGRGGVWRIPPALNGSEREPLPRFTVLTDAQRRDIEVYFRRWGEVLGRPLRPGGHVFVASNPTLQMHVQRGMADAGYELRAVVVRLYHGFRGGDRPKNAEADFPSVCVTPRGNYEPWLLFRKPIAEKTVARNLRTWATGGLRMLAGGRPLPDVIPSFRTPRAERAIAPHPALKPQHLLRVLVRSLLPLGEGVVLDPFMGSGSTLAAARAVGYESIGVEADGEYYRLALAAVPRLAALYPGYTGDELGPPAEPDRGPVTPGGATPSLFAE